jgi:hypothetical protein
MSRKFSLALLAVASTLSVAASMAPAAAAEARQDRYCLQGRNSGYPGNCAFSSYEQCLATASGTDDGCGINPMTAYARPGRGRYGRY